MAITIDELKRNVFPGESGGDYNALFGYANRPGGQFSGVNLTDMTVDQALQFSNPSGPYGQSVKGQIGRVATPMGAYQVVGTTLRGAKEGLGLTGQERMTPELQDAIGMWIYRNQGPSAWEAWGGGQGGGNVTKSSKGTTGMGLLDMPAQQPQTFGQRVGESFRSGELTDRLALAFNSLRMNPDQNLAAAVGQRQEMRGQEQAANRTAQWLSSIGRDDLAQAMLAGSLDPQSAAAIAMTPAAGPERGVVVGGNVVDPVTGEIIYQGPAQSTEPLAPAAFVAMDLQAKAAGFEPGTPQYQEFMATRGAGMAAEARAIGEQRGAAIAGAPIDVATADTTLQLIESVRQDPGLDVGTGATSVANIVPGTPGYDFQNRVDQLLSGGFLTAIDQLRGMGALSNAEGQTATRAISRMDTATSKTAFLDALSDYENVVRMGRERASTRIQQPAPPAGGAPAGGMPSDDDLLNMYGG
jgi:hypothetical protein